jgi:4-amino-4-deoxy-L-arabinose transferase-like glycosyltransferase
MASHRWLFVVLDVLFLAGLGAYVFAGLEKAPFHGDESSFIYSSEDYYTLFYQHDWDSIRVRGNLWRTREQYLRTMDGAVATYTIGLAWDVAGYSVDDLNGSWRWSDEIDTPIDQWVYNLAQGNKPSDHLLYLARIPSTLFTVLSIVVLYVITLTLAGTRLAAWVACLSYATTPAILLNGRRAMQEGPLLFSTLIVILVAMRVIRAEADDTMSWRRRAAWYLGLGAASGFAMASKHTAAAIIAAAFLTVGVLPQLQGRKDSAFVRRHYATLAAAALLAWWVMIALLPVWWSLPILIVLGGLSALALTIGFEVQRGVRLALVAVIFVTWLAQPIAGYDLVAMPVKIVAARGYLMHKQTQSTYHQDTLRERVKMLVDQAYFAGPQYYEDPLWADFEPITVEIAAYEHAHLDGRRGMIWGVLLIALDGLGAWWLYVHRRQGTTLLIGCWLAILVLMLLANPLAWQRYYIVLTAPLSLVAGLGAHALLRLPHLAD